MDVQKGKVPGTLSLDPTYTQQRLVALRACDWLRVARVTALSPHGEAILRRAGCVNCARPDPWEAGEGNPPGRPDKRPIKKRRNLTRNDFYLSNSIPRSSNSIVRASS